MKKTPVVAVAIVLALSTQACTVTPKASVMSSSAKSAHPAVVVKHPVYQPAVDGPPPVYRANTLTETVDATTASEETVGTDDTGIGVVSTLVGGSSMSRIALTIFRDVVVTCVRYDTCW